MSKEPTRTTGLFHALEQIDSTTGLDGYLREQVTCSPCPLFSDYFNQILFQKGLDLQSVIKKSSIESHYAYQIVNGTRKKPGRDKVIALCISAQMTLKETQRALEITQNGILYPKNGRDAVIIISINREYYDVRKTNEQLYQRGFEVIGSF